jgi:hypothetical protein
MSAASKSVRLIAWPESTRPVAHTQHGAQARHFGPVLDEPKFRFCQPIIAAEMTEHAANVFPRFPPLPTVLMGENWGKSVHFSRPLPSEGGTREITVVRREVPRDGAKPERGGSGDLSLDAEACCLTR